MSTPRPGRDGAPRHIPTAAYAVLLAAYVALGLITGVAVLNWVVGPLFPLLVLHVLPRAGRRIARRVHR